MAKGFLDNISKLYPGPFLGTPLFRAGLRNLWAGSDKKTNLGLLVLTINYG